MPHSLRKERAMKGVPGRFDNASQDFYGAIRVAHEYAQRLEVPFWKIDVISPELGNGESIVFLVPHIADVDFHERSQRDPERYFHIATIKMTPLP